MGSRRKSQTLLEHSLQKFTLRVLTVLIHPGERRNTRSVDGTLKTILNSRFGTKAVWGPSHKASVFLTAIVFIHGRSGTGSSLKGTTTMTHGCMLLLRMSAPLQHRERES